MTDLATDHVTGSATDPDAEAGSADLEQYRTELTGYCLLNDVRYEDGDVVRGDDVLVA